MRIVQLAFAFVVTAFVSSAWAAPVPSRVIPTWHWPYDERHIRVASNLRTLQPSNDELLQMLSTRFPIKRQELESRSFHGLNLKDDSPYMLDILERLLTYTLLPPMRFRKVESTLVGWTGTGRQYQFSSRCQTSLCAAQSIFGEREALQLFVLLGVYGLNASHFAWDAALPWSSADLDIFLMGAMDLPREMFPIAMNSPLIRATTTDSGTYAETKVDSFDGQGLYFFSKWAAKSPEMKRAIFVHELGHLYAGYSRNIDVTDVWLQASGGWRENAVHPSLRYTTCSTWAAVDPTRFVSTYALTNPFEDFAESFAAYRYNPSLLASMSPVKYRLLKESVYGSNEYMRTSQAKPSLPPLESASSSSLQIQIDEPALNFIERICGERIFDGLHLAVINRHDWPADLDRFSQECVSGAMSAIQAQKVRKLGTESLATWASSIRNTPWADRAQVRAVSAEIRSRATRAYARFFQKSLSSGIVSVSASSAEACAKTKDSVASYAAPILDSLYRRPCLRRECSFAFKRRKDLSDMYQNVCMNLAAQGKSAKELFRSSEDQIIEAILSSSQPK